MNKMDLAYSCKICMELFNEKIRPRTLKCGHSFCTKCLGNFIHNGGLLCPICQHPDKADSPLDYPINFNMEEMMACLSQAHELPHSLQPRKPDNRQEPTAQSLLPEQNKMSSIMSSILQSQKISAQNLIHKSMEVQSEFSHYLNFLTDRRAMHEEFFIQIIELANRNREVVKQLELETQKVKHEHKEGVSLTNRVSASLTHIDAVTGAVEATAAIEKVDKCSADLEKWNKDSQRQFPHAMTIHCSEKIVNDSAAILATLKVIDAETKQPERPLTLENSTLPISVKMNKLKRRPTMDIASFRGMTGQMASLLKKGHLYAIQKRNGRLRSAKLTVDEGKVYLHCLQDAEPPEYAHTIEHANMIHSLDNNSVVVFMDLSLGGEVLGRIRILLSPDTPLARNFRILCTGDQGPSYLKSRLLETSNRGHITEECLRGGDYETNNGNGGAPVVSGLNIRDSIYCHNVKTGIVVATCKDAVGPKSSQFSIRHGKANGRRTIGGFGEVISGLNIAQTTAKLDNVRSVEIYQCGVELPSQGI